MCNVCAKLFRGVVCHPYKARFIIPGESLRCFCAQMLLFVTSVSYSFPILSVQMLRYTVLLNKPNMFRNIFLVHGKFVLDNSTVEVLCCLYLSSCLDMQVLLSKFKQQL